MPSKFESLVQRGDARKFHRAVGAFETEQGALPSLEMASFEEVDLSGFDFSGIDLSNTAFTNCTLTQCRFDGSQLDGVYIQGCTLIECFFTGATGEGFCIDGSTLSQCMLSACRFEFPEWTDSHFTDCELADITGDEFVVERTTFKGGRWRGVVPASGEFNAVTLREVELEGCDLSASQARASYTKGVRLLDSHLPDGFTEKTGKRRVM